MYICYICFPVFVYKLFTVKESKVIKQLFNLLYFQLLLCELLFDSSFLFNIESCILLFRDTQVFRWYFYGKGCVDLINS